MEVTTKAADFLRPCKLGDKWGFSDPDGKIVIDAIYEDAFHFDENSDLAPVKKGSWGFIDSRGNVKIKLQYSFVEQLRGGYARVFTGSGTYIFIDKDGKRVSQPRFGSPQN